MLFTYYFCQKTICFLFHFIFFFFFNDTATTEIYTLSLHDALPISPGKPAFWWFRMQAKSAARRARSEEHTSELQSPCNLVCRLLLEKKKKQHIISLEFKTKQQTPSKPTPTT